MYHAPPPNQPPSRGWLMRPPSHKPLPIVLCTLSGLVLFWIIPLAITMDADGRTGFRNLGVGLLLLGGADLLPRGAHPAPVLLRLIALAALLLGLVLVFARSIAGLF
jgi:hypothetical protein